MNKIFKYRLPHVGGNEARMRVPMGFRPLHVAAQLREGRDVPMLWAIVDEDAVKWEKFEWWVFRSVHSGVALGSECTPDRYVGTALLGPGGVHVTHYFGWRDVDAP